MALSMAIYTRPTKELHHFGLANLLRYVQYPLERGASFPHNPQDPRSLLPCKLLIPLGLTDLLSDASSPEDLLQRARVEYVLRTLDIYVSARLSMIYPDLSSSLVSPVVPCSK